jgi:hypothetical protein
VTAPSAFTVQAQSGSFPPAGRGWAARIEVRRSSPDHVPTKGRLNWNAVQAAVASRVTMAPARAPTAFLWVRSGWPRFYLLWFKRPARWRNHGFGHARRTGARERLARLTPAIVKV